MPRVETLSDVTKIANKQGQEAEVNMSTSNADKDAGLPKGSHDAAESAVAPRLRDRPATPRPKASASKPKARGAAAKAQAQASVSKPKTSSASKRASAPTVASTKRQIANAAKQASKPAQKRAAKPANGKTPLTTSEMVDHLKQSLAEGSIVSSNSEHGTSTAQLRLDTALKGKGKLVTIHTAPAHKAARGVASNMRRKIREGQLSTGGKRVKFVVAAGSCDVQAQTV